MGGFLVFLLVVQVNIKKLVRFTLLINMFPTERAEWIYEQVSKESGPFIGLAAVKELTGSSVEEKIEHVHGVPKTWGWVKKVMGDVEKVHVIKVGYNFAKGNFAKVFFGIMELEEKGTVTDHEGEDYDIRNKIACEATGCQ